MSRRLVITANTCLIPADSYAILESLLVHEVIVMKDQAKLL